MRNHTFLFTNIIYLQILLIEYMGELKGIYTLFLWCKMEFISSICSNYIFYLFVAQNAIISHANNVFLLLMLKIYF